jgi:hypothetical protein
MGKKLKKNIPLIAFLLFVNVVGFLSAQAYFSQASGSANMGTHFFLESISFNPKMVAPAKWLEMGIEMLKNLR